MPDRNKEIVGLFPSVSELADRLVRPDVIELLTRVLAASRAALDEITDGAAADLTADEKWRLGLMAEQLLQWSSEIIGWE